MYKCVLCGGYGTHFCKSKGRYTNRFDDPDIYQKVYKTKKNKEIPSDFWARITRGDVSHRTTTNWTTNTINPVAPEEVDVIRQRDDAIQQVVNDIDFTAMEQHVVANITGIEDATIQNATIQNATIQQADGSWDTDFESDVTF